MNSMNVYVLCNTEDQNVVYAICDTINTAIELQRTYKFATRIQQRLIWTLQEVRDHAKG